MSLAFLGKVHEISLMAIVKAAHQFFASRCLSVWTIKGLTFLQLISGYASQGPFMNAPIFPALFNLWEVIVWIYIMLED